MEVEGLLQRERVIFLEWACDRCQKRDHAQITDGVCNLGEDACWTNDCNLQIYIYMIRYCRILE